MLFFVYKCDSYYILTRILICLLNKERLLSLLV